MHIYYARRTDEESRPYLFGDLLALARLDWVRAMRRRVAELGYPEYRAADGVALRVLLRGPRSISELGRLLGVTRQAARKLVDTLVARGLVEEARDEHDARRVRVALNRDGEAYAAAVVAALLALNRELGERFAPEVLAVVDNVLRASMHDEVLRTRARSVAPPVADP